jgi:hypothetical protein
MVLVKCFVQHAVSSNKFVVRFYDNPVNYLRHRIDSYLELILGLKLIIATLNQAPNSNVDQRLFTKIIQVVYTY